MTRVKAADSHDFAALLEELDTLLPKEAHSTDREAAQKWLLALWITRDADAAVTCVAGKQDKFLGSMLGFVLGSVAPDTVAAVLAGPLKNDLGEFFPSAALHSLATADPREFLKLASDKNAAGSPWIRNWPRALATPGSSEVTLNQTGFLWLFDSALQSGPGDRQTRGGGVERTRAARAAFRSCATDDAIV